MAIHFSCACGKRLRVHEDFQCRRIRCPSCGEVSVVPPEAQEQRTVPARTPPPETVDADDGPDEARDISRPRPRARRKKKQKRERSRAEAGQIEIFGIPLTLKTGVVAACVLLLVAGVVYFFISLDRCKVVEARRVDVYAALDVANRNMAKEILGMQSSRILKPGSQTFVIIHDSPQGQAVLVHVKLPPKFLIRRTNPTHGTLVITGRDFLLQGDGPPVEALLLDVGQTALEVRIDEIEAAPVSCRSGVYADADVLGLGALGENFSSAVDGAPVLPRDRPPWKPQGKTTKQYRDETVKVKQELLEGSAFICVGTASFQGQSGMEVNYDFQGNTVIVNWDSGSRGYCANAQQVFLDRFLIESLEVICIFPRPSGKDLTLTVLGERVGAVHPQ